MGSPATTPCPWSHVFCWGHSPKTAFVSERSHILKVTSSSHILDYLDLLPMAAESDRHQHSGGSTGRRFSVGGSFLARGLGPGCPLGSSSPVSPASRWGGQWRSNSHLHSIPLAGVLSWPGSHLPHQGHIRSTSSCQELRPLEMVPFYQHPHFLGKAGYRGPSVCPSLHREADWPV